MKNLFFAALSASCLLAAATSPALAQEHKASKADAKIVAKTALVAPIKLGKGEKLVTLKVPKMYCQGCAQGIKQALLKQRGIKTVSANPQTKVVNITYLSAKQSPQTLAAALTQAGWPATQVKPAKSGATTAVSAPGCCEMK